MTEILRAETVGPLEGPLAANPRERPMEEKLGFVERPGDPEGLKHIKRRNRMFCDKWHLVDHIANPWPDGDNELIKIDTPWDYMLAIQRQFRDRISGRECRSLVIKEHPDDKDVTNRSSCGLAGCPACWYRKVRLILENAGDHAVKHRARVWYLRFGSAVWYDRRFETPGGWRTRDTDVSEELESWFSLGGRPLNMVGHLQATDTDDRLVDGEIEAMPFWYRVGLWASRNVYRPQLYSSPDPGRIPFTREQVKVLPTDETIAITTELYGNVNDMAAGFLRRCPSPLRLWFDVDSETSFLHREQAASQPISGRSFTRSKK